MKPQTHVIVENKYLMFPVLYVTVELLHCKGIKESFTTMTS